MTTLLLSSPLVQGILAVLAGLLTLFVSKKVWEREAREEESKKLKEKDQDNATEIRNRVDSANDKWMHSKDNDDDIGYRD